MNTVTFTMDEVQAYLEDMINMGGSDYIEEELYNSIQYEQPLNKEYVKVVTHRMIKLYDEKF